jgi:aspartate aminotransferase
VAIVKTNLGLADRVSLISMSATMKVSADAARLKKEGVDVVGFGAGEPGLPTPEHISERASRPSRRTSPNTRRPAESQS